MWEPRENSAVRGIAFLDPDPNADPKTGIAVDGVPLTRNAGILNDAFDHERVEILRARRARTIDMVGPAQSASSPSD